MRQRPPSARDNLRRSVIAPRVAEVAIMAAAAATTIRIETRVGSNAMKDRSFLKLPWPIVLPLRSAVDPAFRFVQRLLLNAVA